MFWGDEEFGTSDCSHVCSIPLDGCDWFAGITYRYALCSELLYGLQCNDPPATRCVDIDIFIECDMHLFASDAFEGAKIDKILVIHRMVDATPCRFELTDATCLYFPVVSFFVFYRLEIRRDQTTLRSRVVYQRSSCAKGVIGRLRQCDDSPAAPHQPRCPESFALSPERIVVFGRHRRRSF